MDAKDVDRWNQLDEMKIENRQLRRSLRRQRWIWRGLTGTALVASIALCMKATEDKIEDEQ